MENITRREFMKRTIGTTSLGVVPSIAFGNTRDSRKNNLEEYKFSENPERFKEVIDNLFMGAPFDHLPVNKKFPIYRLCFYDQEVRWNLKDIISSKPENGPVRYELNFLQHANYKNNKKKIVALEDLKNLGTFFNTYWSTGDGISDMMIEQSGNIPW